MISIELTLLATSTFWCKQMVIIVNAIDFIVQIHSEWNAIEAIVANATAKASGMIGFSHGMQDLLISEELFIN